MPEMHGLHEAEEGSLPLPAATCMAACLRGPLNAQPHPADSTPPQPYPTLPTPLRPHPPHPTLQAYKLSQQAAPGAAVLWTNPTPQPFDVDKDYSGAAEGAAPYKAPSQLAVQPHAEGAGGPSAYGDSSAYDSSAAYYAPVRPAQV